MGAVELNIALRKQDWSPELKSIFGVTRDDPFDLVLALRLIHPDDIGSLVAAWIAAMDPGGSRIFEQVYRIRRLDDGTEHWVHSIGAVVFEAGATLRIVGSAHEITDERCNQIRTPQNISQVRALIETSASASAMFDRHMNYLAASALWRRNYCLQQSPVGRNYFDVFPLMPAGWKAIPRHHLDGGSLCSDGDLFDCEEGDAKWLKWSAHPWRNDQGDIGGLVITSEDIAARKEAEARAALASIVEASRHAAFSEDLNSKCTSWNSGSEQLFGYTAAEMVGRPMATIIPEARRDREGGVIRTLQAGETINAYRTTRLTKAGCEIDVRISVSPIRDGLGEIVGALTIVDDTYPREEIFHLAATQDAVICKALNSHVTIWNANAERLFGYSSREMIGQNGSIIVPPDLLHEEAQILSRAISGGRVERHETVRVAKEGRRIHVLLTAAPITNALGKVIGASMILRDISAQKNAETALHRSLDLIGELKATLYEHAIVIVTDSRGVIIDGSANFWARSQYRRDELIGRHYQIINSDTHSKQFFRGVWRTVASGRVWRGEICARARNGSLCRVEMTIVPFLDDVGRPKEYLAVCSEINDRKRTEAQLREGLTPIFEDFPQAPPADGEMDPEGLVPESERMAQCVPDGDNRQLYEHPVARATPSIALIGLPSLLADCLKGALLERISEGIALFPSIATWRAHSYSSCRLAILFVAGAQLQEAIASAARDFERIKGCAPYAILADNDDDRNVKAALDHGARGFIPTSVSVAMMAEAIDLMLAGAAYYPASVLRTSSEPPDERLGEMAGDAGRLLSPRERSVFKQLREGRSNKIIAVEMGLSENTVKVYVHRIMRKLHVQNRTQAALSGMAFKAGPHDQES
jgi:PAS domain S-box-containing protein